ncbi:MAG: hypothetical protein Aurels2KO_15130 [Aureliella sp.]
MEKRCAFLTMEDLGDFFAYDHLLHEPMQQHGWSVIDVPWTDDTDWAAFDAVVIRSPWDYQSNPERFLEVLDEVEKSPAKLFNSLEICRWNLDKVYLRDLQERGVRIIPTQWIDRLNEDTLSELLDGADQIVVKPRVGAGADDTFVISRKRSESTEKALDIYSAKPLMVQPFVPSIQTVGEMSLFYFAGQYSHSIIKRPKLGDFRVQEEHGGVIEAIVPSKSHLQIGQQAMDAISERLLYARVDVVRLPSDELAVIELELIEPSLYFPFDVESPQRFVDAFCQMMDDTAEG